MEMIKPMGCLPIPDEKRELLIAHPNYVGEKKYDGSRYILHKSIEGVFLTSRRESVKGGMCEKGANVPHILQEAQGLPFNTILDGEIDIKEDARNFKLVQGIMGSSPIRACELQYIHGKLVYKVFDVLYWNGVDYRTKPFRQRRLLLNNLMWNSTSDYIKLVPQFVDRTTLLKQQLEMGNEGIVIKNLDSYYQEGKKPVNTWYKIKQSHTFEAIIRGYTPGEGKYEGMLGALSAYQYVGEKLVYVGEISGMTDAERVSFKDRIDEGQKFIVEFKAQDVYHDTHRYRFPAYVRERTDKNEKDCIYGI